MLHNTGNKYIFTVTYRIHLYFFTEYILVYQYRVFLCNPVYYLHEAVYIIIICRNLHSLTSQYIGRSYKYRITEPVCRFFCLLCLVYCLAPRSWNLTFFKDFIKKFSVLRRIHIFCICTEYRNSHLHKALCQLDGCLSAKLYYSSVRFFYIYNTFHIFRSKRFKIKLIRYIKIRTDCFRIVIDYNGFISKSFKFPS